MPAPAAPTATTNTPHGAQLREGFRMLRFRAPLETEYRAAAQRDLVHPTLVAALAGTAIWLVFSATDLARVDLIQRFPHWSPMQWQLVIVRVLVLLALLACSLRLWSGAGAPRQSAMVAGMLFLLTLGSGVAIIIYRELDVPHESYALALVVMAIFLPLGLGFFVALALALACICSLLLLGMVMLDGEAQRAFNRLSVVLLATCGVSAISAYLREYAQRGQFLLRRELEWQAKRDPLTSLFNRRVFHQHLDTIIRQARNERCTVVLVMLDVDHFKLYNDTYGHQAGDVALQHLAQVLDQLTARPLDQAFRTGGEEMSLILYDATLDDVHALCTQLLREVHQLHIAHSASATSDRLSVSAGCALLGQEEPAASLYPRADRLLYQAKSLGRNCVVLDVHMEGRVLRGPAPPAAASVSRM